VAAREAMMWPCSCKGDGDVAHAAAWCTVIWHMQLQWGLQRGASSHKACYNMVHPTTRCAACAAAIGAATWCVQL